LPESEMPAGEDTSTAAGFGIHGLKVLETLALQEARV
jgi:hypothetical protein